MGRNDIVYADPVGATITTKSEKVRSILFVLDSTQIEPPRCLSCKEKAEFHMGLRIEGYPCIVCDLPFCGSCKAKLEASMETRKPPAEEEHELRKDLKEREEQMEMAEGVPVEYPQGRWELSDEPCSKGGEKMLYKGGHLPRYHCEKCGHELEV